jgi:hypothetical protein
LTGRMGQFFVDPFDSNILLFILVILIEFL